MMSTGQLTAVVATFPEVDNVVRPWRTSMDPSAEWGVPAHVTIMFPFLPLESVTDEAVRQLADALAGEEPFDCTFEACRWFDDDVLWLELDHAFEFQRMTASVEAAFPGVRLYGGEYSDVIPHLTIGDAGRASRHDLREAEAHVNRMLPITERVSSVVLMAGSQQAGSWHVLATLPLGSA